MVQKWDNDIHKKQAYVHDFIGYTRNIIYIIKNPTTENK